MRLFLLSVVISFSSQLLGQYLWCDTYLDKNNTNNRNGIIDQQGASFKLNKMEHINIALSLFNIHESDEWGKVSSETINEAVEHLNRVFQPSNISFFILDEIKYIESDYLSYFNYGENSISQNMIDNLYSVKGTMNVYLLPSAHENNTIHVGWAAKAYFPEEEKDKILILAESFSGSVLAHEMGHALSLYHTHETQFGKELVNGSNCSTAGDLLCDTPADPGIYDDSVDPECKYINVSKDSNGDKYAPLANNIMSYAPNKCRSVFTPQQIERMRLAYYHYKTHLHKKEYMALFSTDDATICVGQTAHFSNKSLNAESYHWSFEGGHPSSSTNINPIVLYERPGDYDVTLTITTKEGDTHSFVEENCIVVKNKAQFEDVMVSGSFENNILLEEVINPDYGSTFELTNSASSEGNQCVMFNLYSDYLDGAQDFLIIGQLNNSRTKTCYISFDYAYAGITDISNDELALVYRSPCGDWVTLWKKTGSGLATAAYLYDRYFTPQPDDWRNVNIPIHLPDDIDSYELAFRVINRGGNAIYIDNYEINPVPLVPVIVRNGNVLQIQTEENNIVRWYLNNELVQEANSTALNISSKGLYKSSVDNGVCVTESETYDVLYTSISDEHSVQESTLIYPNPTKGEVYVKLPYSNVELIRVIDVSGTVVHKSISKHKVNLSFLPDGMYVIEIQTQNCRFQRKVLLKR